MTPAVEVHFREMFGSFPAEAARMATADALICGVANTAGVDHVTAFAAYLTLPVNFYPLLDCREGVAVMASALATMMGCDRSFEPTSH